ncbi:hypothetical protein [Photobacterium leiognathi]|uniref:hypothetical protein n=1 Tax=Photobacterium leiognathi TaxID=553611 RepID=UPI002981BFF7|nr:hypothetical protein [Photobacterium leiognathi]
MPRNHITQAKVEQKLSFLIIDKDNHTHYRKILSQKRVDIHAQVGAILPKNYELSRIEHENGNFAIVLLDHSSERIAYYIKASILDIDLNTRPITQVLLWCNNDVIHEAVTTGLARSILFNHLLNNYNITPSDSYQNAEGREFWIRQTGFALATGYHVYRFHRINCELLKIVDHAIIRDNSCDLWGDDVDYCNVLAVISKKSIPNTNPAVNH